MLIFSRGPHNRACSMNFSVVNLAGARAYQNIFQAEGLVGKLI